MSSKNFFATLLVVAFALAAVTALPYERYENYAPLEDIEQLSYYEAPEEHLRVARSPRGGSIDLGVNHDRFGTVGSAQYNHNLWSANHGNSRLDAYAQASKNFDHHGRPNYGGGLTFEHRF